MKTELIRVDHETLLDWPRPDVYMIPKDKRKQYVRRHRAVDAYMSGASLAGASRHFNVNRNTLTRMIRIAIELDAAGTPWGYRACLPYFHGDGSDNAAGGAVAAPVAARPHSFGLLIRSNPSIRDLVCSFGGNLPAGRRRSAAFNRLFGNFKQCLKGSEHLYPLNTPDKGRRALLEYIKRGRLRTGNASIGETPPPQPGIERLDQLFRLSPFSRAEYDGHHEDIEWMIEVPTPDGGWTTRKVSQLTLIPDIDAVSRIIHSWTLVLGRGYRQYDLMEMFAKGMRPWSPGVLTTPDLCYVTGAGMPSSIMPDGKAPRSILHAGDNFSAHQAAYIRHNLLHVHLGVWNWAQAHIPEKRAIIEAFFHHIEHGALRGIAGGYVPPAERVETAMRSNALNPKHYPLNVIALQELMDVIVTAYNAEPHRGLQGRSPLDVADDYVRRGGWVWQSNLSERHAQQMACLSMRVTIRGNRKESRQPYVEWKGAKYRSDALINRFDLVGKEFDATIPSDDLRVMTLYDDSGKVFVRLPALPPWAMSKHDVRVREQVIKWDRAKALAITGVEDAVAAFHNYLRATAHNCGKSADLYARHQPAINASSAKPRKRKAHETVRVPREGWIGAERMEDLP